MKIILVIAISCFSLISLNVMAIDKIAKKKYPYQLITDDYGILDENDLAFYTWNLNTVAPFSEGRWTGRNYWQCFPTSGISFDYKEGWYSDEDKSKVYSFFIIAKKDNGDIHRYMRSRPIPKDFCQEIESDWKKLMQGQQHVCLGGSFISHKEKITQEKKIQVYTWDFNKIKTKNSCDSYFTYRGHSPCEMTYEDYQKYR